MIAVILSIVAFQVLITLALIPKSSKRCNQWSPAEPYVEGSIVRMKGQLYIAKHVEGYGIVDNTTHNFWYWVVFGLLCIWQLPQFIVGVIIMPFIGKLTKVANRHYNLCLRGTKMSGGISLGPFSFVSNYQGLEGIGHEVDGHTVDSKIFGPIYLLVIGIPSLLNACFEFTKCYYDFYTERLANKHAGLKCDESCKIHY